MNQLSRAERAQIIRMLVEGNSLRSVSRMTGFARNTISTLLVQIGRAASAYQDRTLRDLTSNRIECDEIWSFVGMKEKSIPEGRRDEAGIGDVWTWVAIDPDTKLVPSWVIGDRDDGTCRTFMLDLASRLSQRIQLSTDGFSRYPNAIEEAFRGQIDYAMVIKEYGIDLTDRRFSPPVVQSERKIIVNGDPDPDRISTSYVERQNLTMRMSMRRFTRLTNAFSKKVENHAAMVSLHFLYYNFGRVHGSLGKLTTPAMAAGLADHVWTCDEIAALLDPKPNSWVRLLRDIA
jgi:IS1 family transposase